MIKDECIFKNATSAITDDIKESTPTYTCIHGYALRWYAARLALGLEYIKWSGHKPEPVKEWSCVKK
jgi:hypothetical protein